MSSYFLLFTTGYNICRNGFLQRICYNRSKLYYLCSYEKTPQKYHIILFKHTYNKFNLLTATSGSALQFSFGSNKTPAVPTASTSFTPILGSSTGITTSSGKFTAHSKSYVQIQYNLKKNTQTCSEIQFRCHYVT